MEAQEFLEKHVFIDLENLNDGFDTEGIHYFSEEDFTKVLARAEHFGIGIYGIEPWLDGNLFDVKSNEDYRKKATDPRWFKNAFIEFKKL